MRSGRTKCLRPAQAREAAALRYKRLDRIDHAPLIAHREAIVKRQTNQPFADRLGYRAIPLPSAKLLPHLRQMQGLIVEHAQDLTLLEVLDKTAPALGRGKQDVEKVIRRVAMRGNAGQLHAGLSSPSSQFLTIRVPDSHARGLNLIA